MDRFLLSNPEMTEPGVCCNFFVRLVRSSHSIYSLRCVKIVIDHCVTYDPSQVYTEPHTGLCLMIVTELLAGNSNKMLKVPYGVVFQPKVS